MEKGTQKKEEPLNVDNLNNNKIGVCKMYIQHRPPGESSRGLWQRIFEKQKLANKLESPVTLVNDISQPQRNKAAQDNDGVFFEEPQSVLRQRRQSIKVVRGFLEDFCNSTSIQGLKQIAEPQPFIGRR